MAPGQKKILIVAGEASGDLHGSKVAEALLRLEPQLQLWGMGGDHLRRAGVEILIDSSRLAVVGITEVLGRMGSLYRAYRNIKKLIQRREISLLILIDFPDFNLRLARVAREKGIPVLYYISPQVWAWRSGRIKKIAQRVQKMAVIFPFEVSLYREAGLEAQFVGHPLMDVLSSPSALALPGHPQKDWRGTPLITLLPGSRQKEVLSLLPEMVKAAQIITRRKPEAQFLLALAPAMDLDEIRNFLPSSGVAITMVEGRTYQAIRAADLVIVASGTATLETAILGKPMVIIYRVSPLTYWVGRAMVKVKWIGLANIVAERALVPELLQGEMRGERIAEEAFRILDDEKYRQEMIRGLAEVGSKLGNPGAADRVAEMALGMIKADRRDQDRNL
ncbi:MAG TPA: lipid-A-disaccharide synthase [Thermodesulfobacteriota bacterium]|nr:lipid-A-disaccharide synthase [Thermodesulfobacteriota bacterium]